MSWLQGARENFDRHARIGGATRKDIECQIAMLWVGMKGDVRFAERQKTGDSAAGENVRDWCRQWGERASPSRIFEAAAKQFGVAQEYCSHPVEISQGVPPDCSGDDNRRHIYVIGNLWC
jgi:hypothetical protein